MAPWPRWIALAVPWLLLAPPARGETITPAWTYAGSQPAEELGYSVASAGDVNGDGYDDILVGAPKFDNGHSDEGVAYLFLGSSAGLRFSPAWAQEGGQSGALFGSSVASAGDINADGFDDVLIGAPGADGSHEDEGAAFLYLGSQTGLPSAPFRVWYGDQAGARFGSAVGSAGDVNADEFDDVLVGAPGFDGGEVDEGAAFLFLGGSPGPAVTAAWSAEGNQAGAWFGASVAALGDMNGDGFGDVAVGAPLFDGGQADEGTVRAFGGSSSGLGASPIQSYEHNVSGSRFGTSVSGARNLSGDGVPRVLFGAPIYRYTHIEEGGTFMATLGQTPFFLDFGRQDFAHRGISIASAGDVNGDGLEDVVIGADRYDQGEEDEGLVTVHFGHPSFVVDRTAAWTVDVDQAFCGFGFSVATAGDVNGDGFDDVIAGAPLYDQGTGDEGRAFVYWGPSGVVTGVPAEHSTRVLPSIRQLGQSPFRSELRLAYSLPRAGRVHLSIIDVQGRRVAILADGGQGAGSHVVVWDGRDRIGSDSSTGIYFVRFAVEGTVVVRRVLRMR